MGLVWYCIGLCELSEFSLVINDIASYTLGFEFWTFHLSILKMKFLVTNLYDKKKLQLIVSCGNKIKLKSEVEYIE
jgi:hypothetical protein